MTLDHRRTFRGFVDANVRASRRLDRLLPAVLRVDGNQDFKLDFVWSYLQRGQRIYDVGGGKQPFLTDDQKTRIGAVVIGLDISEEQLTQAPAASYDVTIAADIQHYRGSYDGDVVVCQALLEHVPDVRAALTSLRTLLKPGGILLLFVPCRNAPFARLNLLLPESVKRRLLFGLFPSTRQTQGFPSFYDSCTPSDLTAAAIARGLKPIAVRHYYISSYFSFFFPLYALWRLWTLLIASLGATNFCETFSMAFVTSDKAGKRVRSDRQRSGV